MAVRGAVERGQGPQQHHRRLTGTLRTSGKGDSWEHERGGRTRPAARRAKRGRRGEGLPPRPRRAALCAPTHDRAAVSAGTPRVTSLERALPLLRGAAAAVLPHQGSRPSPSPGESSPSYAAGSNCRVEVPPLATGTNSAGTAAGSFLALPSIRTFPRVRTCGGNGAEDHARGLCRGGDTHAQRGSTQRRRQHIAAATHAWPSRPSPPFPALSRASPPFPALLPRDHLEKGADHRPEAAHERAGGVHVHAPQHLRVVVRQHRRERLEVLEVPVPATVT